MALDNDPFLESKQQRIKLLVDALACERQIQIIDVGANPINPPPYQLLLDAGLCHIWGFDPHPGAFNRLTVEKSEHETYFQTAVGDGTPKTLNIYGGSGYTSVYKLRDATLNLLGPQGGMTQLRKEIVLETVRLDDLEEMPQADLLKIDIQGGELDVFQYGRSKLKDAVTIYTEVPFVGLYEDAPSFGEIDVELRSQGFVLHRFVHQIAKMLHTSQSEKLRAHTRFTKTQLLDGDAIYLPDITAPEKLSDEQWKYLALFSDNVFDSNDLTLVCLDHLVKRNLIDADLPNAYVDLLPVQMRT